ncbi:c-type cytochrome [Qipengyuania psychrotolerans]|uniref:Cytochrome c family protein n=1 Tax=Qipengyuania psychrotolerans TaxID=2867238 RepID=A0ABX8ZJG4_9SPHN|nr:cytochrome c family protein [Qipengyuania psychrotolerans]QZD87333.1 cytochrome c family protein [Qipengyuania psychrotolerans]
MDDRFNTAAGWVLFAGIVALGASIASGMFFHADSHDYPEGQDYGYFVKGEEVGAEESGPDLGTVLASADAAAGEKVFAKCTACHTIDQGGANGIGPNLYGVMGTPIGAHAAGFAYSSALSDKGGEWSWENMNAWLTSPRGFANGTKMSFAGLSKPEDRANVMEFMATYGGAPAKPAPAAVEEAVAEDAPGAGPGPVEGVAADGAEAAGAMSADQPVAAANSAAEN